MQPWLVQTLIDQGIIDAEGYTRKAKVTSCSKCGATTIKGLTTGDRMVERVDLDVQACDNSQELAALVAGRPTYRVRWRGSHYEIDWRSHLHIGGEPASRVRDVHAAHRCGQPVGTLNLTPPPPRAARATSEPPY